MAHVVCARVFLAGLVCNLQRLPFRLVFVCFRGEWVPGGFGLLGFDNESLLTEQTIQVANIHTQRLVENLIRLEFALCPATP